MNWMCEWMTSTLKKLSGGLDARTYRRAGIATVLGPLLKKNLKPGATLLIVGGKCKNCEPAPEGREHDTRYPKLWTSTLYDLCTKQGVTVEYLFIEPSEDALKNLDELALNIKRALQKDPSPSPTGSLFVFEIQKVADIIDEELRQLAIECKNGSFCISI
jgi:hypothetical protein